MKCHPETTRGFVATLDHVHPRSKGGDNTYSNLVLSCSTCNKRKADTLLPLTHLIAANVRRAVSMPRTEEQVEKRWTG